MGLTNLGIVQSELREYAAAKQSHEQALAIRRKALLSGPPRYRLQSGQPEQRAVSLAGLCWSEAEL